MTTICEQCGMIYDVSNNIKMSLYGGSEPKEEKKKVNIKRIIKKILREQELTKEDNYMYLSEHNILDHDYYKKLSVPEKSMINHKLSIYLPKVKVVKYPVKPLTMEGGDDEDKFSVLSKDSAFYICTNCKFFKAIKPGTLLYSQRLDSTNQFLDLKSCSENVNYRILPRDRNYSCPNKKCETHKTPSKAEQVTKKYLNVTGLIHTCTVCKTSWKT